MKLVALLFKLIFKIKPLRKHYYGLYKYVFNPNNTFDQISTITTYDTTLKIKVDLCDWIQQQIYFLDYSDQNGINFLKKTLQKGDYFLDIGANIGGFSLVASKLVGDNGKVFAFEAVKHIKRRLDDNIKRNKLKNITVIKGAVFDKNTELELFLSNKKNSGMSSILRHTNESGLKETVMGIRIDDFFKNEKIPKIKLIKLDIEGAEINAIAGMAETLSRYKPLVLMEISDGIISNSSYEKESIFTLMKTFNYSCQSIDKQGNIIKIKENKAGYHNYLFTPSN